MQINIPKGKKLFVVSGRNDDGSAWPKAVPVIATSLSKAQEIYLKDEMRSYEQINFEDEDDGVFDETEYVSDRMAEYGRLWIVSEIGPVLS